MSSPCHIELVLTEKNSDVKNEAVRFFVPCVAGATVVASDMHFTPDLQLAIW